MIDFIQNHKEKILELRSSSVNEAVTKSNLIDPLFQFLGWDIHNFREVEQERKVISGNFVDYALKIKDVPIIYVEAKKISDDLNNFKNVSQAISYANDDGIEWCLLTNGDKINLYKTREPGDLKDKLVFEIRISTDYHLEFLDYFKKENIEKDILSELDEIIIINKVIKGLNDLFNILPDDFVEFLDIKFPQLTKTQIKGALENIDVDFVNRTIPSKVEFETIEPKITISDENSIEIVLPEAKRALKPYWKTYKLIPIPKENRRFFPGYKIPFTFLTDVGNLETHMTSRTGGDEYGDPDGGTYVSKNIHIFYREYPDLKPGAILKITKLEENFYKLEIKKNNTNKYINLKHQGF